MHEFVKDRLFRTKTEYGHTLHLALQHAADTIGQNGWVAIRGTDQYLVSVSDSHHFKNLNQVGEEGVGNVLNDDAEKTAAAGNQGARVGIWKVIQLLDRLPDSLGKLLSHSRRAVDRSRDGGDGDLCEGCDGAYVGRLDNCPALSFSNHEPFLFHMSRNFHYAFPATTLYRQLSLLRSYFCIR